ncbi:TetR/AcrR family transcriptional regulator [Jannaschia seohaensis]|uniref:TetR/AcrR family transcriptional regulator n=1 Tax=Jannaschia seohaensis TaxID=475081 RepID=UPI001475D937|nr:TetR/AcrR family transcriptional regulator [Jannaschia seohaensis]
MNQSSDALSSKERLLKATAHLLAERGYDGVGLALIAKTAKTTTGSLYFHFPEGKEELAVAAIDAAAEGRRRRIGEALDEGGPSRIAYLWADHLEASDWKIGCPVAATTLQMSSRSEPLRQAGQRAFHLWQDEIAKHLKQHNSDRAAADLAARQILSLLEGAELLARTDRSRRPLVEIADVLDSLGKTPATKT